MEIGDRPRAVGRQEQGEEMAGRRPVPMTHRFTAVAPAGQLGPAVLTKSRPLEQSWAAKSPAPSGARERFRMTMQSRKLSILTCVLIAAVAVTFVLVGAGVFVARA